MAELKVGETLLCVLWIIVFCTASGSIAYLLWKTLQYIPFFRKQVRAMRNAIWLVAFWWLCPMVFGYWIYRERGPIIRFKMFEITPVMKLILGIVLAVWLAGVIIRLFFLFGQMWQTKVMKQNAGICDEKTEGVFQEVLRTLGIRRKVQVRLNTRIPPLVTGGRISCVMLPSSEITETDMRMIFIHELTHVQHRDDWLRNLLAFISCLHWYNPFAVQLMWDMDAWNEYYCDCDSVEKAGISKDEYFAVIERSIKRTKESRKNRYQQIYKDGKKLKKRKEQMSYMLGEKAWGKCKAALLYVGSFICVMCLSFAASYVLVFAYDSWYMNTEASFFLEVTPPEAEVHTEMPWEMQEEITIVQKKLIRVGSRSGWTEEITLPVNTQYEYGPIAKDAGGSINVSVIASAPIQFGVKNGAGVITWVEHGLLTYSFPIEKNGFYYVIFRNISEQPVTFVGTVVY